MLRCNINVTIGLVNGAMGTVVGIYSTHVLIKFDHIDKPCQIEKITTKFMLMKNMYIHRKQYPLILAFAITIHKCQGLSLDTAIIDLSQWCSIVSCTYIIWITFNYIRSRLYSCQ